MSSYLSVRQNLSIYTLSSERPLPSIDSFAVAALVLEALRKLLGSVLRTLIGIEHLRPTVLAYGLQKHIHAKVRRQRV